MRITAVAAVLTLSIAFCARAHAGDTDGSSNPRPVKRLAAEPMDLGTPLSPANAARLSPPDSPMPQLVARQDFSPQKAGVLAVFSPLLSIAAGSVLWSHAGDSRNAQLAGIGMIVVGLWVGPSAGHIYAGEWGHAVGWSLFRAATSTVGGAIALAAALHGDCEDGPPGACDTSTGTVLLGAGLLLAAGASAVYDFVDAPRAAERANQRSAAGDLALAPIVSAADGGGSTRGLALVGRF